MENDQGYDVLRLIEHGQSCYISSEYVKGQTLARYIQKHNTIEKELLFSWMQKMAQTLVCVHKCRGAPCYQYVNPYSMIVTEELELYFLDLKAPSNQNMLTRMQKRIIREHFLPEEAYYYQRTSVELDLYGLARTYQYMLAQIVPSPELTRKEILKLEKLIARGLNWQSSKACGSAQEIKNMIPTYKMEEMNAEPGEGKRRKRRILLIVVAAALFLCITVKMLLPPSHKANAEDQANAKTQANAEAQANTEAQEKAQKNTSNREHISDAETELELGSLYFLELEDYEKSRKHYEMAAKILKKEAGTEDRQEQIASAMAAVAACLEEDPLPEEEIKSHLEEITPLLEGKEDAVYYRCAMKGYQSLTISGQKEELVRLGTQYRALGEREGLEEVTQWMAAACEEEGKKTEAARLYEELLKTETEKGTREELYCKISELYLSDGKTEESMRNIRSAVAEYPDVRRLQILKLNIYCKENGKDRKACKKMLQNALKEQPNLKKEDGFRKLIQEQGYQIKGDKLCERK